MTYQDFKICTDKYLAKYNIEDDALFERIELTKEEIIDSTHVYLEYIVHFNGTKEYPQDYVEPREDKSYFIKIEDKWFIDLKPEFEQLIKENPGIEICSKEVRRAIDYEKEFGLETIWVYDEYLIDFIYKGYYVQAGTRLDDKNMFIISNGGDNKIKVDYEIFIENDLMEIRQLDNPRAQDQLIKRLDYVTNIATILDKEAPGKYFDTLKGILK